MYKRQLYNHRHFYELLEAEISRSERYGERFALLMVDMDRTPTMGLKAVNDTYGHQAGDQLLKSLDVYKRQILTITGDGVHDNGGNETGDRVRCGGPGTERYDCLLYTSRCV